MARQTMRGLSRLALLAVVPLAVGGCSYITGELDQLRQETNQHSKVRPRSEAKPVKRVARTEPHTYNSVPGNNRNGERTATPLVPRPVEPEPKAAPVPAPQSQAPRSPTPAVVPVPAPQPAPPAPATPAPPADGPARIINPSSPPPAAAPPATPPPAAAPPKAPAQPDTLPTEPGPPPPRQEPLPAPPNRANITPPRQAGGGVLVAARPDPAPHVPQAAPPLAPIVLSPQGHSPGETLSKSQLAARLDLARRLLQRGKVVEARISLQVVVRTFPAAGLHELARTYDPYYLGQLPKIDDGSEPRTAASLYQDAINHGATAAGNDLDRLRASYPALR